MRSFLSNLSSAQGTLAQVLVLAFGVFTIWMLIDAIRREEWLWVIFILLFPMLNAPLYFFLVYRSSRTFVTRGFQFPGTFEHSRIKRLEGQIHHLDKAHHHLELGDIYFHRGKLQKALDCYLKALERDAEDQDIRAHLGQCLLRLGRPTEARPLLETVTAENAKHDYGHSLMALAETYTALNQSAEALKTWQRVLGENAYARARVQMAELLAAGGNKEEARAEIEQMLKDDACAPAFDRRRDRVWVKRAKKLLKTV